MSKFRLLIALVFYDNYSAYSTIKLRILSIACYRTSRYDY